MKKHLNLVWLAGFIGYVGCVITGAALNFVLINIIGWLVYYMISYWVLKQKKQSTWWLLLAIVIPILGNKHEKIGT